MKSIFSKTLLWLFFLLFSSPLWAQGLQQGEGPCLYGIKIEGECNEKPSGLSWKTETDRENQDKKKARPPQEEEICFCGISPAEEGVCLDSCEEAKHSWESEAVEDIDALPDENDICLFGVDVPGVCRSN